MMSKKAMLEALHRDFADERDFPVAPGSGDALSDGLPDDPSAPLTRKPTPWTPLQWLMTGVVLVLIAQVPLLWAFSAASEGEGPLVFTCLDLGTPKSRLMTSRERLTLEQRCNPNVRTVETFITAQGPKEDVPKDAQVVELDMPEAEDPKPVETKYVSDRTTRTEKETRAEASARSQKKNDAGARVRDANAGAERAVSPRPTGAPDNARTARADEKPVDRIGEADKALGDKEPQVADIVDLQKGDAGTAPPRRSVMERGHGGGGAQILMPVTSEKNTLANLQALSGEAFASSDHLPDVERGKSTVLNANSYKYADFFHGVKRAVERHWRPNDTYLRRDPTGQVYGVKDRYTVLRVELDRKGGIVTVTTVRTSGLDFMDEEAKRAFREAAPFPNPPLGLADEDGRIRFEFGFYFEITGGKYRFNWRRL